MPIVKMNDDRITTTHGQATLIVNVHLLILSCFFQNNNGGEFYTQHLSSFRLILCASVLDTKVNTYRTVQSGVVRTTRLPSSDDVDQV